MTTLSVKSDDELQAIINNHRRLHAEDKPAYLGALAELARRKGQGLDFEKSLAIIVEAASQRRYVGYKQLAEKSGAEWAKVHWSVGPHLDTMLEYCVRKNWPLLPAIVVRQDHVATGRLRGSSLEGFIKGCKGLGIDVPLDGEAFADAEQDRVFHWAISRAKP